MIQVSVVVSLFMHNLYKPNTIISIKMINFLCRLFILCISIKIFFILLTGLPQYRVGWSLNMNYLCSFNWGLLN